MNIQKKELLDYLAGLYKLLYETYPELMSEQKRQVQTIEAKGFLKVIYLISSYGGKTAKEKDIPLYVSNVPGGMDVSKAGQIFRKEEINLHLPEKPSGYDAFRAAKIRAGRPYAMINDDLFIGNNSKFIKQIKNIMEENKHAEAPIGNPNMEPEKLIIHDKSELSPTDIQVIKTKALRKSLDENLQQLRALTPSREVSLSITKVQEAIMWLGMNLKQLNDTKPYPESYNPANTIVEPTADGLKM
jgi:hypothetical protein